MMHPERVVLREEHRPALGGREAIAVDVGQIDVAAARHEALLQDLEALVDQGIEEPNRPLGHEKDCEMRKHTWPRG